MIAAVGSLQALTIIPSTQPSRATTRMTFAGYSMRIRVLSTSAERAARRRSIGRSGAAYYNLVSLLLDRGANVHAVWASARGLSGSFWTDLQAIDLAIWDGRRPGERQIIQLLLERGATRDLTVAAALGGDRTRQADP